jgi:hypothetical protein
MPVNEILNNTCVTCKQLSEEIQKERAASYII